MNIRTHLLGGVVAGLATTPWLAPTHALPFVALAALAAPLPDLDHPGSTYGRVLPLPGVVAASGRLTPYRPGASGRVGRRTPFGIGWHRGGTHSLVFTALVAAGFGWGSHALWPGTGPLVGAAVAVGMLSHLALDGLNMTGQAWLWPFSARRFRWPGPRIRVGHAGETVVGALLLAALLALLRQPLAHVLAALPLRSPSP